MRYIPSESNNAGALLTTITPLKVLIFVLGSIALVLYLISGLEFDHFFVNTLVPFIIFTFISIIFSLASAIYTLKKWIKLMIMFDVIIHALGAIIVLIASIVLLVDVTSASTPERQAELGDRYPLYFPERIGAEVRSWEGLVAGIVTIVQSVFHGAISVLLGMNIKRLQLQ